MIELESDIQREYDRALSTLPPQDEDYGEEFLTTRDILRAHFLIANHFYLEGEGLGGVGPKSLDLLRSAVSRQVVSLRGQHKWTDRFDICATVCFGLIKNHPFYDANKRTAFLSVLFLLQRYGWCPSASEKDFENITVDIADNRLDKFARYKAFKRDADPDAEVKFISWFLRRNTRKIDKAHYAVTYREVQTILNRYGFGLSNPRHNHIDIVRYEKKSRLFGLLNEETHEVRLGQIGFPRWTAQMGKAALKTVREVTGLTHDNGVDSGAFFKGLDPMQSLITTYHEPLRNLASR